MKLLTIVMLVFIISCTSGPSVKHHESEHEKHTGHHAATVPLNGDSKWKADETTKKNVAAMMEILNDSTYQRADKRKAFAEAIRSQFDTLVKECSMKGPVHDALHIWLEKALKDVKDLEEGANDYRESYASLKKDVESFYTAFE